MKLNCDLGEGVGNEAEIMPLIDQVNIACGGHAGDQDSMQHCLNLAKRHGVEVGAHPSYPDRENFGRRSINISWEALRASLQTQLSTLRRLATDASIPLAYIKPHGALYNDMMKHQPLRAHLMAWCAEQHLALMLQASPNDERHHSEALTFSTTLIFEAFADRRYLASGALSARSNDGAVLDATQAYQQAIAISCQESLQIGDTLLPIQAQSLCVHGDSPEALATLRALSEWRSNRVIRTTPTL